MRWQFSPAGWMEGPAFCDMHCNSECAVDEDRECLRKPLDIMSENMVAWEVFRASMDQWNMNGGYDFTLAIKIMEHCGLKGLELVDQIWRLRTLATFLKEVLDDSSAEEKDREEFFKLQSEKGLLR